MATETVTPEAEAQYELRNKLEGVLSTVSLRAKAVLAIFDSGDFYAVAAAEGDEHYALLSAAELLLNDIAKQATEAMGAIEAAGSAARQEVARG